MTLSSSSRQHRKSMLPAPRLSSRISSRRAVSGDTSKIARRVPSPLLATSCNNNSTTQARVAHPALPELGSRHAGSPSRIPWPSKQTSSPISEQSEASSLVVTPRPEIKRADTQYPTSPASTEAKHERSKGQEGRTISAQPQDPETRDPAAAAAPARHPSRRPASTALTLSRAENGSPGDAGEGGGPPALTRKKSAFTSSVSGKENRRPPTRTRVPAPPPPAASVTAPRSIRRPVAAQPSRASFRETSPRPLVIRKKPAHARAVGAGAPVVVPAGIKALMGDIDRFANEWTEMFDDVSVGADGREDGAAKLDISTRIHPIVQPDEVASCEADNPTAGKQLHKLLFPGPSSSAASVSTLQAPTLASTNGEMPYIDVTPANLARWQHRDNAMVKNAPMENKLKQDLSEVPSASTSDPHTDGTRHHQQKADFREAHLPMTPQASRYLSPLPEINQSPIISGSRLVEMDSVVFSNRKGGLTKLSESPSTTQHGIDAARRSGTTHHAKYGPPNTSAGVSSSPLATIASLSSVSLPYSSSPWVNLRVHEFASPRPTHGTSDVVPTRSSSLRGLRAIFKRTSAGLTGSQRQRAESLKDRIGEPRILSLGSVSISNLRDAGVAAGPEERTANIGDLARKTTVRW
ncbi:hypothetical protein BJV74DRAFT_262748 [Russula compacta]|nr:hypothetical protein BJV74DRAFT_262748 [Russula compacta]